ACAGHLQRRRGGVARSAADSSAPEGAGQGAARAVRALAWHAVRLRRRMTHGPATAPAAGVRFHASRGSSNFMRSSFISLPLLRHLALLLVACLAGVARAAAPQFPAAGRVGLQPPPGMTVSNNFAGFEDRSETASILIAEMPAAAYVQL